MFPKPSIPRRILVVSGQTSGVPALTKGSAMEFPFENRIWDPAETMSRYRLERLQIDHWREKGLI